MKKIYLKLVALALLSVLSVTNAWATFTSDGSAYLYINKWQNLNNGTNNYDFSQSSAVLWLYMWGGTAGANWYKLSHIDGDVYGAKITTSGTYTNFLLLRKDPGNADANNANWNGEWGRSYELGIADNKNYITKDANSVYRPGVSSFTLTASGFTNLGGSGTSESPYLVLCGAEITFTASSVSGTVNDDSNMTLNYDFKENDSSSKQKGSTSSYTYTATTTPNSTFRMKVYAYNNYQSGDGSSASQEKYFKTIKYFVVGNGETVGDENWCGGADWNINGSPMSYDATNSEWYLTFNNVSASSNLIFTVTDGANWSSAKRYAAYYNFCGEANVTVTDAGDGDHNTKLSISDPSNITIYYKPSTGKICATAVGLYNGLAVAISDANAASTPTISASYTTSDEPVTITAYAANTGYTWAGWTANGGSITSSSSLITTWSPGASNKTATANYTEHISTITINTPSATEGTLSTTGSKSLGKTTTQALEATPADGYVFDHWTVSGVARLTTDNTTNPTTVTTNGDDGGTGSVTAVFAPRYVLRGSLYTSDTQEGMPGWGTNDFGFAYASSEWSVTTNSLTKSTKYKFKIYDRKTGKYMGLDTETEYTNGSTPNKAFTTETASEYKQHGWFNSTFAGPYKFVLDKTNMKITITFNSKTLPDYSGKSVTQALNSAASGYVIGEGTSANHYQIYQSMSSEHGKVDLTMNYSGVTTAHDGIWYSVGGVEKYQMAESESVATATMSMSTDAGTYSPALLAYGKVDDQYNLSYAASAASNLYYDVIATPTLEIDLTTTSDVAITTAAGLEVGNGFKIVPTLSGAIRSGEYITYSYSVKDADSWTTIASSQGTASTYSWTSSLPTEPNIYTIKATYNDLGVTVEATQDITIWKNYTIYVWDPDDYAKRVHIYNASGSVYDWSSTNERMASKSASWGTGWYYFDIKYPLYNKIKLHLDNGYSGGANESVEYTFTQEPLVANNNVYFRCTNKSDANWLLSSIEEPQMPSITITSVNIYATKMVIDVAYDNHYSLLTASSLTVDGVAKDISGSVTNVGGGTYRCTLTGLEENTDYMFRASATNALGTTNEALNITTLAKAPIKFTIKVSANLMKNMSGYWAENGKTTVKVKYYNVAAGIAGNDELTRLKADGDWWWYEYTFEDSPVTFYVCDANYSVESVSGDHRSAEWQDASSNNCLEVIDDRDAYSNHKVRPVESGICGTHYKLGYTAGGKTTYSNMIGDDSEPMSIFLGGTKTGEDNRVLKLYKYTTGWDDGTSFASIPVTDSAVYVIRVEEHANFESLSANTTDLIFEKYTGDYYIRTDKAPGGWNNYKGNSNKMTYSDYAAHVSGSTFDHYFCKWVQGNDDAGRNVKFDVANDYNNSLASGNDGFAEDDFANSVGQLKQNANVRFMYDSRTNKMSRAYLSGSSSASDRFLILRGNSSNKLYKVTDTNEKGDEYSTDSQLDWALFKDNNNWIYQLDVFAKPGTKIKLTARFKDKSNINRTQSFLGEAVAETVGDDTFTDSNTELLIGGSGETFYQMRVIYDFKTNRLMTAWIPTELGSELAIHADVMLVREGQGDAQQITLNNHDLKNVHTVYAVMQFNRWKLNNRANPNLQTVASCAREVSANNWVYDETVTNRPENHPALTEEDDGWLTQYERDLYWISFPFDVNLNEVFGSVGTYGTHWIIEYYDGKGRAQNGFWADSPSNWKFITNVNTTLKAYEGYILALDLDYFAYNNTTMWANNIHQVELYFPSSSSETSPIKITTNKLDVEFKDQSDYQCHIDRRTDKTTPNTDKDRRVVDSYWHCIGTPSFHDIDTIMHTIDENPTNPGAGGNIPVPTAGTYWEPEGKMFLYKWNKDNTLSVITSGSEQTFKSMWSYMVQYSGSKLTWHSVSQVAPNSVAARVQEFPDREFCLKITRDSIEEDHTYVRLTDDANVTNAFEFNYDLCKEQNGGKANIWTVTTDVIPVAGNSMPKPVQTTVVPVGVKVVANGEYTFSMPEGTNGENVVLIDNAYGTRTNLGLTDYTVTLTSGTYDGRFALEFGPIQDAPTGIDEMSTVNSQLSTEEVRKVFVGGRLYIIRDGKVYDAAGQRVE